MLGFLSLGTPHFPVLLLVILRYRLIKLKSGVCSTSFKKTKFKKYIYLGEKTAFKSSTISLYDFYPHSSPAR